MCVFVLTQDVLTRVGQLSLNMGGGGECKVCIRCVFVHEVQAENALACVCVKQTAGVRSQVTYLRVCSHVTSCWVLFFFFFSNVTFRCDRRRILIN